MKELSGNELKYNFVDTFGTVDMENNSVSSAEIIFDEELEDLSNYTVKESCLWLLNKLRTDQYMQRPYTLPYCSYVSTWHESIPLNCIIMAQSPYPQNVYPPIAAAMSYDTELAIQQVANKKYKVPIPPTVEIFANDLYINAKMKKEDSVNILKNGWALIHKGILLVNEGVFCTQEDPDYYIESSSQCNVIIRMLKETEKYGKRTVDVYGLGEAGQKMASDLCSWYKSEIVRLSKHTATNPAALARRYNNFNDPNCHMGVPSFSKGIAKHLGNHVAFIHIMSRKSEVDIKIQRWSDILRNSSEHLVKYDIAIKEMQQVTKELLEMDKSNQEIFNSGLTKFHKCLETLSFRTSLAATTMSQVQSVSSTVSGNVSKSGPNTVSPSVASLSQHTGSNFAQAKPIQLTPQKIELKKRKGSTSGILSVPSSVTGLSNADGITTATNTPVKASTERSVSVESPLATSSIARSEIIPIKLSMSKRKPSANSTNKAVSKQPVRDEDGEPIVRSSLSTTFGKTSTRLSSSTSKSSGKLEEGKKSTDNEYKITKDQRNQLSCIEAVVQANKSDFENDEDVTETLELIQHDISHMTVYNNIVSNFITAINSDMAKYPSFDFSHWTFDSSKPSDTYELCKTTFNF